MVTLFKGHHNVERNDRLPERRFDRFSKPIRHGIKGIGMTLEIGTADPEPAGHD